MKLYLSTILVLLFLAPINNGALGQDGINLIEKTFFSLKANDRVYFLKNKTFQQQLENDWEDIPAGTLIAGKWTYDDAQQELCMNYEEEKIGKYCYNVFPIGANEGVIVFDEAGNHQYTWSNPRQGNWLINPNYFNAFKRIISGDIELSSEELSFFDEADEKAKEYIKEKVLHGNKHPFKTTLSYLKKDFSGLYRDNTTNEKVPYTWTISNSRLNIYDKNGKLEEDNVFTIGREFLEPKNKLIYYNGLNRFYVEGDEINLTPIMDHPEKLFLLN